MVLRSNVFMLFAVLCLHCGTVKAENILWQYDFSRDKYNEKTDCFGILQNFKILNMLPTELEKTFDKLAASGKKILPYLGSWVDTSEQHCKLNPTAIEFIDQYGDRPEIYAWHTFDEPGGRGISKSCQQAVYDELKIIDPDSRVFLSINDVVTNRFDQNVQIGTFEYLGFHRYVNPHIGRKQVSQVAMVNSLELHEDIKLFVTLRAYNSTTKAHRKDMQRNGLIHQYRYYLNSVMNLSGVGVYGWKLGPNIGVSQNVALMRSFEQLQNVLLDDGSC